MRTLYAVSSGWYSDYRVLALFEREADAEAATAAYNAAADRGSDKANEVEEFRCFAAGETHMIPTWKVRACLSRSNVTVELTRPGAWWGNEPPPRGMAVEWENTHAWDWENRGGSYKLDEPVLVIEREGADPQAVRQSFSDRCAQYKAETGATWPTPDLQWD